MNPKTKDITCLVIKSKNKKNTRQDRVETIYEYYCPFRCLDLRILEKEQ